MNQEEKKIIDLTKPIDECLEIYSDTHYSDPTFSVETWCTVESQGYWVSKLRLGTQTGTHIDAPAHFKEGGQLLEELPADKMLGSYFLVDLDELPKAQRLNHLLCGYEEQPILFLRTKNGDAQLSMDDLHQLCALSCRLWVLSGSIEIAKKPELYFHKHIANEGIYLVENLRREEANRVTLGGEIIALPLNLQGTSGSPCRVLVVYR